MSDLTKQTVETVSKLCRLTLSEEELTIYSQDLKRFLDYVEQLQEVDTSDLPLYSHLEEQGRHSLREDTIQENTLTREAFLDNAPEKTGGLICFPALIKQEF